MIHDYRWINTSNHCNFDIYFKIFMLCPLISYLYLILLNIANDFANPKPIIFGRQSCLSVGSNHLARIRSHPLIWSDFKFSFSHACYVPCSWLGISHFPTFMIALNVVIVSQTFVLYQCRVINLYPWYMVYLKVYIYNGTTVLISHSFPNSIVSHGKQINCVHPNTIPSLLYTKSR
jgi:hypothetical protein